MPNAVRSRHVAASWHAIIHEGVTEMAKPLNPYNANDIAGAKAVVESGEQVIALIDKCIKCGMEFQPLKDHALSLVGMAEGVLKEFASGADANV